MSCLVFPTDERRLTPERFAVLIASLAESLRGRVLEAFIFGSAGTPEMRWDSDIDLILVVADVEAQFFWHRALIFRDLYDIYPALDILVYSPGELARQLADSNVGFWKSVRQSMRRIV